MQTSNITYTELISATYHADNSADTESAYNISADIQMVGTTVSAISNGYLHMREGNGSASFYADANNSHFDFSGISATAAQIAALEAIRAFIDGAHASAPVYVSTTNG